MPVRTKRANIEINRSAELRESKRQDAGNVTKRISCWINIEVHESLKRMAKSHGMTTAQVVEGLIIAEQKRVKEARCAEKSLEHDDAAERRRLEVLGQQRLIV